MPPVHKRLHIHLDTTFALLDGLGMKEKKCADLWAIFQLFAPPTPSRIPDVRTVKVELGPAA